MEILNVPADKQEDFTRLLIDFSNALAEKIFGETVHCAILMFSIDKDGQMSKARPITSFGDSPEKLLLCAGVMGSFAQAKIEQNMEDRGILVPEKQIILPH